MMPGMQGVPYDALFIDSMIMHHEGAIVMARQALEAAERPEIRQLAEAIISAQQREIDEMRAWRAADPESAARQSADSSRALPRTCANRWQRGTCRAGATVQCHG